MKKEDYEFEIIMGLDDISIAYRLISEKNNDDAWVEEVFDSSQFENWLKSEGYFDQEKDIYEFGELVRIEKYTCKCLSQFLDEYSDVEEVCIDFFCERKTTIPNVR